MWLSEKILYLLARRLYKTEICHSAGMKESLSDMDKLDLYRSARVSSVLAQAKQFGIDIRGKTVLDFGCGDGAVTQQYLNAGAERAIGVDIDETALARAREKYASEGVSFCLSREDQIPLEDNSVDVVLSYDAFEHVTRPGPVLAELYRVLRDGGNVLIGTWGWYHPYAPHHFAVMPVPWAHLFFTEKTFLRTCRRVYKSPWYVPTMHDYDEHRKLKTDRYLKEEISLNYVNKLLIKDFEKLFRASDFQFQMYPMPFGSRYARWTRMFLRIPFLREFLTAYLWVVLHKKEKANRTAQGSSRRAEDKARTVCAAAP